MKALLSRRRAEPDTEASTDATRPERNDQGMQWTGGPAVATRAVTVALWAAIAVGPAYAVYDLVVADQAPESSTLEQTPATDPAEAVAGEYGTRVVLAWLTATRTTSDQALTLLPQLRPGQLPETAPLVRDAVVSSVTPGDLEQGLWSVTVGYDVGTAVPDSDAVLWSRQYAQVVLQVQPSSTGYTAAAVSLPSAVAGPQTASPVVTLGYSAQLSTDDPLLQTASQFLEAYLTGQGDITRVLTPGTEIAAVTPAPYSQITAITGAAVEEDALEPVDGAVAEVLVTAWVTRADETSVQVQYPLQLTARSGRWEVTAIQSTPVTNPGDGEPSTTN